MKPLAIYVSISAAVLTAALILVTQTLPQFRGTSVQPFDLSWPHSPPSVPATEVTEFDTEFDAGAGLSKGTSWSFDHRRDANNHGLTQERCLAAFPLLYKEIDRAVEYRHKHGNITGEDIEMDWRGGGIVRILVQDNHVSIVDTLNVERGHRFRYLATLNSLNTAVMSAQDKLPDVEFTYTVTDFPLGHGKGMKGRTTLAYSRAPEQESLWLMPGTTMILQAVPCESMR